MRGKVIFGIVLLCISSISYAQSIGPQCTTDEGLQDAYSEFVAVHRHFSDAVEASARLEMRMVGMNPSNSQYKFVSDQLAAAQKTVYLWQTAAVLAGDDLIANIESCRNK